MAEEQKSSEQKQGFLKVSIYLNNTSLLAQTDDFNFYKVKDYNWFLDRNGFTNYVATYINTKLIYMHHLILEPKEGFQIDHKDRNALHNWENNLRYATHNQNCMNRGPQLNNTTSYKGVTYDGRRDKYYAQLRFNGRHIHGGSFNTKEEAALAYNVLAIKYHKEFAYLNIINL